MIKKTVKSCCLGLSACMLLAGLMNTAAASRVQAEDSDKRLLVVVDPGHGGHNHGAAGAGGALEKDIALSFAKVLSKSLKPEYRVELTRTGDYRLDAGKRASEANHKNADLFISIHSGAGFSPVPEYWGVYCFGMYGRSGQEQELTGRDKRSEPSGSRWRSSFVQHKYMEQSSKLAGVLAEHLRACPGISEVKTGYAPVLLLEWLDMPAVVIEAGFLTNPSCEGRLTDEDFLEEAALCIRRGLDSFFKQKKSD